MAEHLGISPHEMILNDPVSDMLFLFMIQRAKNNTRIYSELFSCYPDDKFTSFRLLRSLGEKCDLQNYFLK